MTTKERARPMPAEQRRSDIVRSAAPLLRRHGRAVTTREIAEAAGVAEGTLFHVFADKEAIIAAVVESEFHDGATLAELRAIDPGAPLAERLVDIVEALRRRLASLFELMTSLGMHHAPESARGKGHASHRMMLDVVRELLEPDAGSLRHPPQQTALLIRLTTFAAINPAITDGAPLSADQIVDLLLGGITTHPCDEAHRQAVGVAGPTTVACTPTRTTRTEGISC